jgi:hypothetical protein
MCISPPARVLLALVAAFSVIAPPARATTVLAMDVPALARAADRIVEGRVVATRSEWNESHDQIHTFLTLDLSAVHAGVASSPLEIRFLGGAVGDTSMVVFGAPGFAVGERVLLFLHEESQAHFPVVGMSQGKLGYSADTESGGELVGNGAVGFTTREALLETIGIARAGQGR